jgi:hypothetical protein
MAWSHGQLESTGRTWARETFEVLTAGSSPRAGSRRPVRRHCLRPDRYHDRLSVLAHRGVSTPECLNACRANPVPPERQAQWRVHFYKDEAGECRWKVVPANGEIVADYVEGYRHKGCWVTVAETLNPGAELVIDDK